RIYLDGRILSLIVDATANVSLAEQNFPTVLSVDDSAIIQTTIKRALQDDYNVLLAGKAADALEILKEVQVELMLLDLTMPDVDGLEFCKTVRAIPQFRDLPIVMVTARDGLVNKMKGHIAGTSKYLTKPFKADELREVVRQYIK
ncbi:MAG: response regulator, partial [Cyanobacteria bacterium J06598_4]